MSSSVTIIGGVQVDVVILPVDELPPQGQTLLVEEASMRVGGAAANAAFAFTETPMTVRLMGCVGDDPLGEWLREALNELALGGELHVVPAGATGITVAFEAPGRDRTFLTYLGVNSGWSLEMIPADAVSSEHLLVCDYFLAPALRGGPTMELLAGARRHGGRTYFDTAWDPGGWPEASRVEVLDLLRHVDVFLPNEAEACAASGVHDSPEDAARALQAVSSGWVVVKLGARGCFAAGPEGAELSAPAPAVEISDTTGAGDAFNAGLIGALAEGHGWPVALEAATALASRIIARPSGERHGPARAAPSRSGEKTVG
jgi:sugar/nucleoside kinase (ribokinase family)